MMSSFEKSIIFKIVLLAMLVLLFPAPEAPAGMRGCCSYHGGVCGDKCCDGTALSEKCAGGSSWWDFIDDLKPSAVKKRVKKKIVKSKWFYKYPKALINIFRDEDEKQEETTTSTEPLVVKYNNCTAGYVYDGDTVQVTCDGQKKKVRLWGIDTPEKDQRFGREATHFTAGMVGDKKNNIDLEVKGTDRYNRVLAIVRVDGANVNESLVRGGYAWVYQKYCTEQVCEEWLRLEKSARGRKAGLWEDVYPVAPWNWRHYGRAAKKESK